MNPSEGWANMRRSDYPAILDRSRLGIFTNGFTYTDSNMAMPTRLRYPELEGQYNSVSYKAAIGSWSNCYIEGTRSGLTLSGGSHNLQGMIAHWQSLVDGCTLSNLSIIQEPGHCGIMNRSDLDFQVQFGLAIQFLVSQVGVQDTRIVIF